MKGHSYDPGGCAKCGKIHTPPMQGKHLSESAKCLLRSCPHTGVYGDKNPSKRPEVRKKLSERNTGKKHSLSQRKKNSEAHKKLWKDPIYVRHQTEARIHTKQNKAEKRLQDILDFVFPAQWQFVGDGKLIVAGKCPDFRHTKRSLLIELFGRYWHTIDEVDLRSSLFKEQGYETLVIWDDELNNSPSIVSRVMFKLLGEVSSG